ncbi:MAG: FAD-dependent oxidoreductase [Longimicrobiales bacterium]
MRVAIIGSGISGLTAARELHGTHDVTVFEASSRIGGHTHTWDVELQGRQWRVDSGFIVYNERNYPNFSRMLRELDVASQPTTMSFSVRHDRAGLEYNGSDMRRLFVQPRNIARPSFLRMIRDILRFNRDAVGYMNAVPGASVADMLVDQRYSDGFRDWYLLPMASALWSIPRAGVLAMPARFVISFFDNHSMLTTGSRPEWRVIAGGSATYIGAMTRQFAASRRQRFPRRNMRLRLTGCWRRASKSALRCCGRTTATSGEHLTSSFQSR